MDQVLREKIQIAPSYEIKALLLNREDALFERIGTESTSIIESLKNAVQEISERTTPITVDIKLQDGAPVAIRMH
ncbi:hypothetical protein RAA17_14240 [Komagataeibacter rhaeticus]|nr:hypothetical protein [Komagataeibacter rhaeticus]